MAAPGHTCTQTFRSRGRWPQSVLGLIFVVLLGGCGGEGSELSAATTTATPTTTPTTTPATTTEVPTSETTIAPEPSTTTTTSPGEDEDVAGSDEEPEPEAPVSDATEPPPGPSLDEIGFITELGTGDIACYLTATDRLGDTFGASATVEICERADELVATTSWLVYTIEIVDDCESSEPCGETREEWLVSDAVVLGDSWDVVANDDWLIVVGQQERWDGVNGTGDLTYYGCDQDARFSGLPAGCLALDGGTVTCRDGECVKGWRNGDFTYSLYSPMTGPDSIDTASTLRVRDNTGVILESFGLEGVASSMDARFNVISIDPGVEKVVSGSVIRGDRDRYKFEGIPGQTVTLSIISLEDNAVFDVAEPSGSLLVAEASGAQITLGDGIYTIVVGGTRGNASYDLTITAD
ncbi:MAG: hypothetical protein GWP47_08535 [Actinobacteria bacterium]|nr:hypothetical protein [Actinomycetota bacterium]NCG39238.1 hypothetical protein [Actinomycetota bacterium]